MLTQITIKQHMLLHDVALTLQPGMLAITGESGAGKSMLLNALSLALGARHQQASQQHSTGSDITITFDISQNMAATMQTICKSLLISA